jgi:hypothetical protein
MVKMVSGERGFWAGRAVFYHFGGADGKNGGGRNQAVIFQIGLGTGVFPPRRAGCGAKGKGQSDKGIDGIK